MYTPILKFIVFVFTVLCLSLNCQAGTTSQVPEQLEKIKLQSLLIYLIKNHEEIKNYTSQVEQAKAQYLQSKGLYFPTLDLNADGGREDIDKEYGNDTDENRYSVSLRASQLVTDFGRTTNTIARSDLFLQQAEIRLEAKRQELMLEGIRAYINVVKAREQLKSAIQSEERIKELTGIEKTLVQKGAGLSSDVLQAKSQLAGAMALRVGAEGDLSIAKNRFETVFLNPLVRADLLETVDFPSERLPSMLEDAIAIAREQNPEFLITRFDDQIAKEDIDIAKTAFYPRLNLFAQALRTDNDGGEIGTSDEYSAGLELKYNLLNGGSDRAALRAALAGQKASSYHTDYVVNIIEEQVRNSWEQLAVLRQRSELLDQQAAIVENFLLLAKKERKMGTRSLLDVLNGEINFINATATSIAAREDTKIAAFNLLYTMGGINLALFE